uniref:Uncharacterized protein n=1 Tax=Oryctolagus cuniculus TaxID=9986 RepID=A0A5F9DHW5_RABIT
TCWGSSVSIPACRAGLGRRPSTQHGPQRAEDRQPGASGTAAAGGKEPEPSVHSLAARSRRSAEEPAPPLAVPPTWAGRRVPCRCAGDKSRGRGKLLVAASGKCQENFRKVPKVGIYTIAKKVLNSFSHRPKRRK